MTALASRPLVCIFGAGRNGGTLFARLLDGSPDFWVHPIDVVYVTAWDDLVRGGAVAYETQQHTTTRRATRLDVELPSGLLLEYLLQHWRDIDEVYVPLLVDPFEKKVDPRALLEQETAYTAGRFLPAFLEATRLAYDDRDEPPRTLVFKSVETPYIEDYLRLFPGLRCLHLVRDPVSNYSSTKRSWSYHRDRSFYWGGRDLLWTFLDARWLPHVRTALPLVESDPHAHRFVRYEDVCEDPVSVIEDVCRWIGASPPADPQEQTTLGGRRLSSMPPDPRPSQPGVPTPPRVVPDMRSRFEYTDVVSTRERDFIALRTGACARRLGYRIEAPSGWRARLGLFLRWLPPDASERLHVHRWSRWAYEIARRRLYIARGLVSAR